MRFFKVIYEVEDYKGRVYTQAFETNRHINDPLPEALVKECTMHMGAKNAFISPRLRRVVSCKEIDFLKKERERLGI